MKSDSKDKTNRMKEKRESLQSSSIVYLTDQEFFTLYQLYRAFTYYSKHHEQPDCSVEFLRPARGLRSNVYATNISVLQTIWRLNQITPLGFGDIVLPDKDGSEKDVWFERVLEDVEEWISKRKDAPVAKRLRKFLDGERKAEILCKNLYPDVINSLLDYAIVELRPSELELEDFLLFYTSYLEKFMSDNLVTNPVNSEIYFKSDKQIGILFVLFKHHFDEYPPDTVITIAETLRGDMNEKDFSISKVKGYSRFLPIHALAVMEIQEIVEVKHIKSGSLGFEESLDFYDFEKEESYEINGYRANIKLSEEFFQEDPVDNKTVSKVIFDDDIGLYYENEPEKAYPLKKYLNKVLTGRYKLIRHLADNDEILTFYC